MDLNNIFKKTPIRRTGRSQNFENENKPEVPQRLLKK